jgi:tRNA methyl transferase
VNEGKQNAAVQQVVDEVAVRICGADGATQLLQGLDALKDQSYFLAAVPAAALAACAFPLGSMRKEQVRRAAAAAGSPSASRRSSAGICFIGQLSVHQEGTGLGSGYTLARSRLLQPAPSEMS